MTQSLHDLHVAQATAWFPPHSLGGTEVYVQGLVEGLAKHGVRSTVVVPRHRDAPARYRHAGASIETYPVNEVPFRGEMRGARPHEGFDEFVALLRACRPDIYHQHSWTRGCGPLHLAAARRLGIPTVLTVHVPGNLCLRGTMMENGRAPCDGCVDERRCASCWSRDRGASAPVATLLARVPAPIARAAQKFDHRAATALAARLIARDHRDRLCAMIADSDRIVAVCRWLFDALLANGVPEHKLILSRHGLAQSFTAAVRSAALTAGHPGGPLRLLYLGRWHPTKGIATLVEAMRTLPREIAVSLTIHTLPPTEEETFYRDRVLASAGDDPRIRFAPPVTHETLPAVLAAHDVLAVPSHGLETGPLVVLEAQAVGLHVLGTAIGGIAELAAQGDGGTLLPPGNTAAWAGAIAQLAARHARSPLRKMPRPVRTEDAVVNDMMRIYAGLLDTGNVETLTCA